MFHFFSENGTECPYAATKAQLQAMCGDIPSSLEAILRFCCELCPTNIAHVLTDASKKALSDLDLPADVIRDRKQKHTRVKRQPGESQPTQEVLATPPADEPQPTQEVLATPPADESQPTQDVPTKPPVLKRERATSKEKQDVGDSRAVRALKRRCVASRQSQCDVKQKPCVDSSKSKATRPVRVVKREHPKAKEKPKRISPDLPNMPPLEQFEVEAIMAERKKAGKVEYLVKWRDCSATENSWEPVNGLHRCSDAITAFHQSRRTSAAPSKIHHSKNNRGIHLEDFCVVVGEDGTWWIGRVEGLTVQEDTGIVSNLMIHEYGNESSVVHTAKAKQMAAYKKKEVSQFTNGRPGVGFEKSMITIEVGDLSEWGPRGTILTKNSTVRATIIRRLKLH